MLNTRTIRTGKSHISVKGEMVSFQNKVTLGTWQTDSSCNLILGRDPGTMSLGLDKHTTLELYFANMCRGMKFHYRKTVEHAGIETLRFVPAEDTFHNPQDNPDNSCYCSQSPCLPSGVFDIGEGCKVTRSQDDFVQAFYLSLDHLSTCPGHTSYTGTQC